MEEAIRSPSEINSFNLNDNIFDFKKKRKLQSDQFGLPISKHKCWNHRLSPKPLDILEENQLLEDLSARESKDKAEEPTIDYGSEPAESAKDSNSFMEDHDCATSDAKFETDASKQWSSTATSAMADWSCHNVKDYQCFSDVTTAGASAGIEPVNEAEEYDPCNYFDEIQVYPNIDDCIVEVDGDYMFIEEVRSIEPFKSLNKTLQSNKAKPDIPFLSSGSCSVNQDAETVRKPTIDQEFEEYFSTLML